MKINMALACKTAAVAVVCAVLPLASAEEQKMKENNRRIVREACGAGRWFPAGKTELRRMVAGFIDRAEAEPGPGRIIAAIAPHAGYIYSGTVAGYVFKALKQQAEQGKEPETVVILGLSHRGGFPGAALMDGDAFATPLGETALDSEAAKILSNNRPAVRLDYSPHCGEHSAENQIPFVQVALPKAKLVVVLIGDQSGDTIGELAAGLSELARTRKILVIASSDMLHDPDYDLVSRTDRATLKMVENMDIGKLQENWAYDRQIFCGLAPVTVAIRFAAAQGCAKGTALKYENSGDAHPESRGQWVVGYGAVVFIAPDRF
ncbi:MAG: AmmeMemoRadiSam system protein B [Kiritimatiellae bacterium]|jgi:hypothetical protein|nr:AmmeMemoRadiSam system protein B [Kiritimatiellia bacterium]